MIRFDTVLLLIGMGASLGGCASRSEPIHAEAQQPQRVRHEVSRAPALETASTQPAIPTDAGETTGSVARSNRPWPKRGTPEWDELQAEELAREQRIKEVLSSICRGC